VNNTKNTGLNDAGALSAEQLSAFHRDGFVVVPGLFTDDEMAAVAAWTEAVQAWPETPGRHMMYFEDSRNEAGHRILNRIENVLPFHDDFNRLATGPKMQGACGQLFGEPAVVFKDKINFKLPGGGGFESHQDVQAGWSTYADIHITALITIDRSTVANGCLEMAAGSHQHGLIGSEWEPLTDSDLPDEAYVAIEASPGDAVFFDSFAPHQSGPNRTSEARRVLYFTYNKLSAGDHLAQYYADKRASYPPDIEREAGKEYHYRV
jgi:ectoine hydroxylase-related dioxygenase (phytanoyl-CoA dioxygenase family)